MKNKLAVWGTKADNERVLVALELQAETSKVNLYLFSEAILEEPFIKFMLHEWRDSPKANEFPEGYEVMVRDLSVTEGLLPDDIKVTRTDLVLRAHTEWQFAVLSAKMLEAYRQELAEFKEKVAALTDYDNGLFDNLRAFWDKVQSQSRERNLVREHADELRDGANELFENMKEMRKRMNSAFDNASKSAYVSVGNTLAEVEKKIVEGGIKFNVLFAELSQIQREYHKSQMSNEHRNKLWNRLDKAFKALKERQFGPQANAGTPVERNEKRLSGLEDVMKRVEYSIKRDEEELVFQQEKVNTSEGQLEAQIRMAKIKMIGERITVARVRLEEITATRKGIQNTVNSMQEKEARIAARKAELEAIEVKKAAIKSEIEAETHAKAEAAQSNTPAEEEGFFENAATMIGDMLVDALDTVKAVASVASERAEDALEKAKVAANKAADKAEEALDNMADKAEEGLEKAKVAANKDADKAEDALEWVKEDKKNPPQDDIASTDGIIIDDVVHNSGDVASPAKDDTTNA